MKLWKSIVGKLWATILLLVSFILFIVTALMLEFLGNFHREQAEVSLHREANMIANVVKEYEDLSYMPDMIHEVLDEETNAFIVDQQGEVTHTYHRGPYQKTIETKILANFKNPTKDIRKDTTEELVMPSLTEEDVLSKYLVYASPYETKAGDINIVFIYQNLEALADTTKRTTNIVILSAFIAFILTTIFAFFLSTRITSPLRNMREAANELSKGNFDTKLYAAQNDEIGQLAKAFNQMGDQLKDHVEMISQDKEQLSSILTSMTDAVITFNKDGTILLRNPQAEKYLQNWAFANEQAGKEHKLPAEIVHMLEHSVSFAEGVEDELTIHNRHYNVTISPLYSGNDIRGAVVVIRDMTEQHQLDKLRSDFIANVSHELRTPVAMLQGYSEAILDGVTETDEERDEMIQIIHDESLRMGRLVSDLLDLARMESGHMKLYKEEMPIAPFLQRIVQKFMPTAREAAVTLSLDERTTEDVIIDFDEDRLEQVFTNLIDNAIRHTPKGGAVTIGIEKIGDVCQLTVEDTGAGIPEEDLEYIFERFYKADKARTRVKGGTGLGLSIAKNIVDSHNGLIKASRGEKIGTIMTITMPIAQ